MDEVRDDGPDELRALVEDADELRIMRASFLSGTPEGFAGVVAHLLAWEMVIDPKTGTAIRDHAGRPVIPYADAHGRPITSIFFAHERRSYLEMVERTLAEMAEDTSSAASALAGELLEALRKLFPIIVGPLESADSEPDAQSPTTTTTTMTTVN